MEYDNIWKIHLHASIFRSIDTPSSELTMVKTKNLICIKVWHLKRLLFQNSSNIRDAKAMVLHGICLFIFQLVLYYFPKVNSGISVYIKKVSPSQLKL